MREYETTFIVQPEISDEACGELCTRLDGIVEKHGGRHVMLDDWGKRKLAYEIGKFQKGHYFVLYYLDEGKAGPEIERTLRLEESVLRYLNVRAADHVADPDARVSEGLEQERIQREKAAERAAREAEAEAERAVREAEAAREAEARASAAQAEADAQKASAEEAPEAAEAVATPDESPEPASGEPDEKPEEA